MRKLLVIFICSSLFACNSPNPSESTGGFETIAPLATDEIEKNEVEVTPNTPEPQETIAEAKPLTIDDLVGTYNLGGEKEGGGVVWVRKKSDTQLEFALEAYRGAPSYNSGIADGILNFNEFGKMEWKTDEYGEVCKLEFEFGTDKLDLMQDGSSFGCGFGANVYAGGTYEKTSSEEPEMPEYY